jgi:hypothetical protein
VSAVDEDDGVVATPTAVSGGSPVSRSLLAFAISGGIVAWMVHLTGASVLVPAACEYGIGWTIDVLTVVTALVCVAGIAASVRIHRRAGRTDDARADGFRILAYLSVVANGFSLVLVIAEGLMPFWLGPC